MKTVRPRGSLAWVLVAAASLIQPHTAWAGSSGAGATWLQGYTLVILESGADPLAAARAIRESGGAVAIVLPPRVLTGWIPPDSDAALIGTAGIRSIHRNVEGLAAEPDADPMTRAALRFFARAARGELGSAASMGLAEDRPPLIRDARDPGEIPEAEILDNLQRLGIDASILKQGGRGLAQNSDTMTGTVSVTLFFVESDGTGADADVHDWTSDAEQAVFDDAVGGLSWWAGQARLYSGCWAAFYVRAFFATEDARCDQWREPVTRPSGDFAGAIADVLANFGYSSGDHLARAAAFDAAQRVTYGTDWAYCAFIAANPTGSTSFTDGYAAWAHLGGPYTALLQRSFSWPFFQVFAHESGHIFRACDEYFQPGYGGCESCGPCTDGGSDNGNCEQCNPDAVLCMMRANDFTLCSWTPAQIGWTGSPCAPPPLPAPDLVACSPSWLVTGQRAYVDLLGQNFTYGARVFLGADVDVLSVDLVSANHLRADLEVQANASPGWRDVSLILPDQQSDLLVNGFEVRQESDTSLPFALYLGPGYDGPPSAGLGSDLSGTFALYLGPGFLLPTGGGLGAATSAVFALDLGHLREVFALSGPFALDTRLPAAFAGVVRAQGSATPLAGALVELLRGGMRQQATTTDAQGQYRFYATIAGDYVVRASRQGFAMATSDLQRFSGQSTIAMDLLLPLVSGASLPDLAIAASDLTYTVLGNGSLTLTAMVHNNGGQGAQDVRVRFYDASIGSGIGQYVPIPPDMVLASVAPGEASPATVNWTPPSGHSRFYAFADPENVFPEPSKLDNGAWRDLGVLGRTPPRVTAVSAQYDGLADPRLIGRFLTDIEGAENHFTAAVADDDADVARVRFAFNGTVLEDASPSGGWSVDFDTGSLPPGNLPLVVTAYDAAGLASEPYVATLVVEDWPWWMIGKMEIAPDINPVGFEVEPGYYHVTFRMKKLEGPGNIFNYAYQLDDNLALIGSLVSQVDGNVYLDVGFPVRPSLGPKVGGKFKISKVLLGHEIDASEVAFTATFAPVWPPDLSGLEVSWERDITIASWEVEYPIPLGSIPVTLILGIGADFFAHLGLQASWTQNFQQFTGTFSPGVGAQINATVGVADPLQFFRGETIISPRLTMMLNASYSLPGGPSAGTEGELEIGWRVRGCVLWVLCGDLVQGTMGPWTIWDSQLAARRAPPGPGAAVPPVIAYPVLKAGPANRLGLAWIRDMDPDSLRVDPEVYFAWADSAGVWSAPIPVTGGGASDPWFQSSPTLAFRPTGEVVAAWVQNAFTETQALAANPTIGEVIDHQDLWWAQWDGSTWSVPTALHADPVDSIRADGPPAVDISPVGDQGLCLWTRAAGDSAYHKGMAEIFYATYEGGIWTAPTRLTANAVDEGSPAVAYGTDGEALAVWLQATGTALENHLMGAHWDGSLWSAPVPVSVFSDRILHSPSVARLPNGDGTAVWTERVIDPVDSTAVYEIRTARWRRSAGTWDAPEIIHSDSLIVESTFVRSDQRNKACVMWRGHDGYDGDLFVSVKDMDVAGSAWTSPRQITEDDLTDWMLATAVDEQNNLHFVDLKTDLADTTGIPNKGAFFDGMALVSKGLGADGKITDELNFGFRPLSADLRLAPGSVWLDDPDPTAGDSVLLHARVENIGDVQSVPATVRFYQGHPDSSGVLIGTDVPLSVVDPDSTATVATTWIAGSGSYRLYAVADPQAVVPEQTESNNIALVWVGVVPDVVLTSLAVSQPNPAPGDSVDLSAVVRNVGGAAATGFSLRFAGRSGTIATQPGLSLAPTDSVTVVTRFAAQAGADTLTAIVDPDSMLADPDRTNNEASLEFLVLPDIWVLPDSITYAHADSAGSLAAAVANAGGVATPGFGVSFYRGNPLAGGVLIDSLRVSALAPGATALVQVLWSAPVGLSTIYVVADGAGEVGERGEGNNESFQDVIRGVLPDLAVVPGSIAARQVIGGWTLEAAVANRGAAHALGIGLEFFRGDPDSGGTMVADRLITTIDLGDTTVVSVDWARPDSVGGVIYVVADRANTIQEFDETNNRQTWSFGPATDAGEEPASAVPRVLALHPARPNPFNARTSIHFDLPTGGPTRLAIFDVRGHLVRRLVAGTLPPGFHSVDWDGADSRGRTVASGVYLYRLEAEDRVLTRKLTVLK